MAYKTWTKMLRSRRKLELSARQARTHPIITEYTDWQKLFNRASQVDLLWVFSLQQWAFTSVLSTVNTDIAACFRELMDKDNLIPKAKLMEELEIRGLSINHPKLKAALKFVEKGILDETADRTRMDLKSFERLMNFTDGLVLRAFTNKLIIPDFPDFADRMEIIFEACKVDEQGDVLKSIPFLARQNPNNWACSACSTDGQMVSFGEYQEPFSLQACCRPFLYGLALELLGVDEVHKTIGYNNWLQRSNSLHTVSYEGYPVNPLVNSGSFLLCSLIRRIGFKGKTYAESFDGLHCFLKELAGQSYVEFCNTVYMSEKETASRNKAISYYLREVHCVPPDTSIEEDLDYYFVAHSFEVTCESLALMGSTIANCGVNPYTGTQVISVENSRYVMTIMQICNMEPMWGEHIGQPCKGGGSGSFLFLMPGIFSIGLFSPKVLSNGHSAKALDFINVLRNDYKIHPFDDMERCRSGFVEQIRESTQPPCTSNCFLFSAAADSNVLKLASIMGSGYKLCERDFFDRTVLHTAAVAGNLECMKFFLRMCPHLLNMTDNMGWTALDDAKFFGHTEVVKFLEEWIVLKTGVETEEEHVNGT